MDVLTHGIETLNGLVWGWPMLILIAGAGLYLTLGLRFLPIRRLPFAVGLLLKPHKPKSPDRDESATEQGDITPFNALMTALSATVGTGNIAGVATAIHLGGPGALFWMWVIALVGMATKYAEAVCAVHFREVDGNGNYVGGPMYYIKNGLGPKWAWLAATFALFGMIAGFGIGNTVQSHSVAEALNETFSVPLWVTGFVLAALAASVLLGGITRIASVAGKLVPLMGILYVGVCLVTLGIFADQIPHAFNLILTHAFSPVAATGGFAGAVVLQAIRWGFARGIFSNEAGLGSAPIAHAAAKTNNPIKQGSIAMLGTFIDTIIVCSMTGLVILASGSWTGAESGAKLSTAAFNAALPGIGGYIVSLGLAVFAFTTLLGWSFYGEKCTEYLFGLKAITPFRILWIGAIFIGPLMPLGFVWLVADTLNALMALPNLIALVLLSPVVFKLSANYFARNTLTTPGKSFSEKAFFRKRKYHGD